MKVVIIAVFSMLLVVTYSQSLPNTSTEIINATKLQSDEASAKTVFRPEKSLVFITDRKEILVGGALVTAKCVITVTYPLLKFAIGEESPSNLFIGIGTEPFDKNVDDYLHPVMNLTYEQSEYIPAACTIAMIMFQPNIRRIPDDVRLIPVSGYAYDYGMNRIESVSVGWSKNGKIRRDPISTLFVSSNSIRIITPICENKEHPELDKHYIGGFLTHDETLAGIVYDYVDSEPHPIGSKLFFISVQPSGTFINIASEGKLTIEDIYEQKLECESDISPVFSEDE